MQMNPSTSMAAVPGTNFSGLANLMAMKGRGGDNTLVHMNKSELPYLNMLAKSAGYPQGLPVNPETGLPEANILKTILPVAGAILGGMFFPPSLLGLGAGSALATGIGAGLGSFGGSLLAGKSLKDAAIGGLISGGLSGLGAAAFGGQSFLGDQLAANPATAGSLTAQEAVQQSMVQNPALAGQTGAGFDASLADYAGGPSPFSDPTGITGGAGIGGTYIPPTPPTPFYTPFTGAGSTVASDTAASLSNIDPSKFVKAETLAEASPVKFTEEFLTQNVDKYVPTSRLEAVRNLPKDPGFFDPKSLYGYQPGMDKLEYLKYAAKPATTMGLAGVAYDAATEQGAFEPIKYDFPEEPESTPFSPSNIRFTSRRTGAFPRTEEEALAFAQPGGTRQRFFDQSFFTPAKTGGGLATLEVKKFEDGGPGEGEGDDAGDDDGGVAGDAEGAAAGAPGPGDDAGTGDDSGGGVAGDAEAAAAGAAAAAEAAEAAAAAEAEAFEAAFGAPMSTDVDEEDDPYAPFDIYAPPPITAVSTVANPVVPAPPPAPVDVFDIYAPPPNPNQVATPTDEMVGFGPMGRSGIAATLGGRSVNPGLSGFGYQSGKGRGPFGGYTSTDKATAKADVDKGYATAPVGSFSFPGFLGGLTKTAISVATGVPVGAITEAITTPRGTGTLGAFANVVNPEGAYGVDTTTAPAPASTAPASTAPASTAPASISDPFGIGFSDFGERTPEVINRQREEDPTIEMAEGGSFLEQMLSGGLAATDKAQDILRQLPKPITALLGGVGVPTLTEKLIGKPASDTTAPPPPVRAIEAPVEAPPPPTAEELEEMRDIAVMQQVLSGVPVEAQAGGLISAYQMGGPPSPYFEGMVKGRGDGMSDSIPFTIEGTQPAILSRDEYVLPADIVSMMGNGSSDAGAEKIDAFINDFRVQKYGRGKQPPETRRGLSSVA